MSRVSKLQRWPESNPALPMLGNGWVSVDDVGAVFYEPKRPQWDKIAHYWADSDWGGNLRGFGTCKNIAACHSSLWRVHWRKGVAWLELIEEHQ